MGVRVDIPLGLILHKKPLKSTPKAIEVCFAHSYWQHTCFILVVQGTQLFSVYLLIIIIYIFWGGALSQ